MSASCFTGRLSLILEAIAPQRQLGGEHMPSCVFMSSMDQRRFYYRKLKAGRSMYWILHFAYWHLPGEFFGLKVAPPSHLRVMAG